MGTGRWGESGVVLTDPQGILLELAAALDASGIRYAVGGSVASSRHGEYRATNDVDVLVEIGPTTLGPLIDALGSDYHIDRTAAERAVRVGGTFTAIHLKELVKVDFFVATEEKLHRLQLERRAALTLDPSAPPVFLISAEDAILTKLVWFRRSGEVLERQLRDVAGVLKVRGDELDMEYLGHAAVVLGVRDLLDDALVRAGLGAGDG